MCTDLRIGGQPVEMGKDYRLTVNSFMAEGGDGFTVLRAAASVWAVTWTSRC